MASLCESLVDVFRPGPATRKTSSSDDRGFALPAEDKVRIPPRISSSTTMFRSDNRGTTDLSIPDLLVMTAKGGEWVSGIIECCAVGEVVRYKTCTHKATSISIYLTHLSLAQGDHLCATRSTLDLGIRISAR
jgi:hypothetical protein